MKTLTTREAFRSLPRVAELAAESGGAPIVVTKGKRRQPFLVFLSFESAVRRGIVCRHGEEPAECPVCGSTGRTGRHKSLELKVPLGGELYNAILEAEAAGGRIRLLWRTGDGWLAEIETERQLYAEPDPPTLARALGADRQSARKETP